MAADLYVLWLGLSEPRQAGVWSSVESGPRARLARTSTGAAIAFRAGRKIEHEPIYDLRTAHIDYRPRREITISEPVEERAVFRVLECAGGDTELLQHFFRVASLLPVSAEAT